MVAILIAVLFAGIATWLYLRSKNQAGTTVAPPSTTTNTPATPQSPGGSVYVPPPSPPQLPPVTSGNAPSTTISTPLLETRKGIGHFNQQDLVVNTGANADYAQAILNAGPGKTAIAQPPGTYWDYTTQSWQPLLV